ncbi:hypothetical protein ACIBCH_10810 [Amycolatopsis thailandensis]|uniref:hypothetical protein n=1 Tax=Amycolatopsis thailandensis TaxID=589330 RepID=UPI0037911175
MVDGGALDACRREVVEFAPDLVTGRETAVLSKGFIVSTQSADRALFSHPLEAQAERYDHKTAQGERYMDLFREPSYPATEPSADAVR